MKNNLRKRLRAAAIECSAWDTDLNPPFTDWSMLMEEAADALDEAEDDEIVSRPGEHIIAAAYGQVLP
jgi:hypothetical protein